MLYDLTFLEAGQPWPPKSEVERMERYEQNLNLYEQNHDEVYGDWWRTLRQDIHASLEMVVGFPQTLSNHWGDLLVGEPPAYSVAGNKEGEAGTDEDDAEEMLQDLVERTRLNTVIREACIDYSRFGDALIKVRRKNGRAHLEAISPQIWFPVVDRADIRDVKAHVLAWVFDDGNTDIAKRRKFLHAEIHEPGRIERRVFEMSDGDSTIGRQLPEAEAQEWFGDFKEEPIGTQADGMLVLHVANDRPTNSLFGYDDYAVIDSYVQETETRLAQWSRINDRHADPPVAGPPIARPEAGSDEAYAVATGERYIEVESDTMLPQYIQQNLSVETIKAELDWIEERMYREASVSGIAFGQSRTGYAESGSALRLRMQPDLTKAARIRTAFDPVIVEAIRLASVLEPETATLTGITVGWKDGLPEDEREKVQSETAKRSAGLTSLVSSIMRLENISREDAEKEVERIREEQQSAEPVPKSTIDRTKELAMSVGTLAGADDGTRENGTPPEAS